MSYIIVDFSDAEFTRRGLHLSILALIDSVYIWYCIPVISACQTTLCEQRLRLLSDWSLAHRGLFFQAFWEINLQGSSSEDSETVVYYKKICRGITCILATICDLQRDATQQLSPPPHMHLEISSDFALRSLILSLPPEATFMCHEFNCGFQLKQRQKAKFGNEKFPDSGCTSLISKLLFVGLCDPTMNSAERSQKV